MTGNKPTWPDVERLLDPADVDEWLDTVYAAASLGTTVEELRRRLVVGPLDNQRAHMEGFSRAVREMRDLWETTPLGVRIVRAIKGRLP